MNGTSRASSPTRTKTAISGSRGGRTTSSSHRGYRIGPFEVESSLGEHEAVAEAAVVPKPHPERGNIVKAYVVLGDEAAPSESLKETITDHVKSELSAHEYPREIEFREELPKTVTGKIRRTELQDEAATEVDNE